MDAETRREFSKLKNQIFNLTQDFISLRSKVISAQNEVTELKKVLKKNDLG